MLKIFALTFMFLTTGSAFSSGVFKSGSQAEIDYINSMPLETFLDVITSGLTSMVPMPLDNNTVLMKAIRLDKTIIVTYQFNEEDSRREMLELLPTKLPNEYFVKLLNSREYDEFYKDYFWVVTKNSLCSNAGLSLAMERGAHVIYSYTDLDNKELFQLAFDKNDCLKQEAPLDIMWRDFFLNYFKSHNPYQ